MRGEDEEQTQKSRMQGKQEQNSIVSFARV